MPVLREGELNIKVTLIDGKRSQDRSWRTVHAELRGNRLRLTLLRDTGKASSQVSFSPIAMISSLCTTKPKRSGGIRRRRSRRKNESDRVLYGMATLTVIITNARKVRDGGGGAIQIHELMKVFSQSVGQSRA